MGLPALPSCHLIFKGPRPKPKGDPKQLITLGDHIRKGRLDQALFQENVTVRIGVDKTTICLWERNHVEPETRHMPRIVEFLGYVPYEISDFGEWPSALAGIEPPLRARNDPPELN